MLTLVSSSKAVKKYLGWKEHPKILCTGSLKKMLNGFCWDGSYTIHNSLVAEHRWLQAKVPGSNTGGYSQFFLLTFHVSMSYS